MFVAVPNFSKFDTIISLLLPVYLKGYNEKFVFYLYSVNAVKQIGVLYCCLNQLEIHKLIDGITRRAFPLAMRPIKMT